MNKPKIAAAALALCLLLCSCAGSQPPASGGGSAPTNSQPPAGTQAPSGGQAQTPDGGADPAPAASPPVVLDMDLPENADTTFSVTSDTAGGVTEDPRGVYTITAAGEYTCAGELPEGRLVVDAGEDAQVVVNLSGCLIACSAGAPVTVLSADKVELSAKKGTENKIWDRRTPAEGEDPSGGAVFAQCDLTLKGSGSLEVVSTYNNGVHTKDDLKLKNLTLTVQAPHTALRGNDSVTIESGTITAISSEGDAVKTTSTGLSKKGAQKGRVDILGGTIALYAAKDGIDAAADVNVSGDAVLDIYTDAWSPYSTISAAATTTTSVQQPAAPTGGGGRLAAGEDTGAVVSTLSSSAMPDGVSGATQTTPADRGQKGDRSSRPNGGRGDRSNGTTPGGTTPGGTTPGGNTPNGGFTPGGNMPGGGSFGPGGFGGGWNFGGGFGGFGSNKTQLAYSCKGIKADNTITIAGGAVTIRSTDDGVHAGFGETLESTGANGLGNVTISGGVLTVTTGDDGVHADQDLTISGGTVNVLTAYEGLEANRVYLSGGETVVYATDDAVNANSKGAYQGYIELSGGYLDAAVPGGDTDTLDSNGTILVSGGLAVLKNGQTAGQSFAGGTFDAERGVTFTGGTVAAIGCIGEQPRGAAAASANQTFSAGDYTLQDAAGNVLVRFTLDSSYKGYILCSDQFAAGQTYSVCRSGETVFSFTK